VLVDLIRYNEFMMLHPSNINDTTQDFIWDWNAYFEGKDAFPTDRVSYAYYDTHTGIDDRYPLDYNDGAAFARAAVGDGFYLSRYHHYIHREVRIYNHG
jgi:hypothetical protein